VAAVSATLEELHAGHASTTVRRCCRISIVIPAFNEEPRIARTLRLTLDYLRDVSPESDDRRE